jgi:hypothetical protein
LLPPPQPLLVLRLVQQSRQVCQEVPRPLLMLLSLLKRPQTHRCGSRRVLTPSPWQLRQQPLQQQQQQQWPQQGQRLQQAAAAIRVGPWLLLQLLVLLWAVGRAQLPGTAVAVVLLLGRCCQQ